VGDGEGVGEELMVLVRELWDWVNVEGEWGGEIVSIEEV